MKRLSVLFLILTLFYSCEKERKQPTACALQMKERFKEDLKCTERHTMEVNLYTGSYKNEQVYFTRVMCPNCNTIPPAYGYTCENKKVDFDNFSNVKNIRQIYNSCTREFTD